MKKQNIKKTLAFNCLYELDSLTLRAAAAYLLKRAAEYEAEGYTDVAFDTDTDYNNDTVLMINGTRVETDDEAIARAEIEARKAAASREYDIKVLKATAERLGVKIENI
jgi:hypothetical protein